MADHWCARSITANLPCTSSSMSAGLPETSCRTLSKHIVQRSNCVGQHLPLIISEEWDPSDPPIVSIIIVSPVFIIGS